MTILSNRQIHERLGDSIVIDPFEPANVNTSSYDVRLGEWYYVERRPALWRRILGRPEIYNIWDFEAVKRHWGEPHEALPAPMLLGRCLPGIALTDRVILLPPKATILAHTIEFIGGRQPRSVEFFDIDGVNRGAVRITLPSTSYMHARSSMGRNGIEVCKCAGFGDVGYTNRWTMEITNNLQFTVPLVVGRRIAQIVFSETGEVDGGYDGKYQGSIPTIDYLKAAWTPEMMLPRLDRDRENPITCSHGNEWDECPVCRH